MPYIHEMVFAMPEPGSLSAARSLFCCCCAMRYCCARAIRASAGWRAGARYGEIHTGARRLHKLRFPKRWKRHLGPVEGICANTGANKLV